MSGSDAGCYARDIQVKKRSMLEEFLSEISKVASFRRCPRLVDERRRMRTAVVNLQF
jgi:hypothetical protein